MPATLTSRSSSASVAAQPSGFICVDKPSGITSFDVIRELRRILRIKKMGHSGVLDRPAQGLLVVGVNNATRLFELFSGFEKEYDADLWFGLSTSTDDLTGQLCASRDARAVTREEFEAAASRYLGSIDQVPPAYSLTKMAGREMYRYALAGQEVEAAPKRVELLAWRCSSFEPGISPGQAIASLGPLAAESKLGTDLASLGPLTRARVHLRCRGGFYVRSFARDLGRDLGLLGCMGCLTRTRVGPFGLEQALTLGEIAQRSEEGLADMVLPLASIAAPEAQLVLDSTQIALVRNGRSVRMFRRQLPPAAEQPEALLYGVDEQGELRAVLTLGATLPTGLVELRPVKVLG